MDRPDLQIKVLKEQLITEKRRVLGLRRYLESLQTGYEQVILEYRKQFSELQKHIPKAFFVYLINRVKKGVRQK